MVKAFTHYAGAIHNAESNSLSDKCKHMLIDNHQGQQYSMARAFSRCATEFAICHRICCLPQKNAELPIFATFISNSGFLGSFFILPFIKQHLVVVRLLL